MIGGVLFLLCSLLAGPVAAQETPASSGEPWWAVVGMGGVLLLAWAVTRLVAQPILARLKEAEPEVVPAGLATGAEPGTSSFAGPALAVGDVHVDLLTRRAHVAGREIVLTTTEFDLLLYFLRHPGQALSRADLLREVWGHQQPVHSRTVDTHVQRLRDKLGSARDQLETVRGVGYRLQVPVTA